MNQNELPFWLALWRCPELGVRRFAKLLTRFGRLSTLFDLPSGALRELNLPAISLQYLQSPDWKSVEQDLQWLSDSDQHHIITWESDVYPSSLAQLECMPPILFCRGQVACLPKQAISVVGSRRASPTGLMNAKYFAKALSDAGLVVVSGLALGIDGAAHQGALLGSRETIGVLGGGIDCFYPRQHRGLAELMMEKGLVITAYPTGVRPLPRNFPQRNAIVSALGLGVLVVEASPKSGSLITARLALEQGREVFALPGSIHNPLAKGGNRLISEGAYLVEHPEDILSILGWSSPFPKPFEVTQPIKDKKLQRLWQALGHEQTTVDTLVDRSQLPLADVLSGLTILEAKGYLCKETGGFSRLNNVRENYR